MSKTHKLVVTGVVTTIATATVLTFTRGDGAPADRAASLPQTSSDAPVVARATDKPVKPRSTTPSPKATEPGTTTARQPSATAPARTPAARADDHDGPAQTPEPSPSPSPTPRQKNLIEILLGQ